MKKSLILALCAAAALSACGGSDDSPSVTEQIPPAASRSVDGFISYLRELVVASADTLEPVDTSAVTPPTDDTAEPTTVN